MIIPNGTIEFKQPSASGINPVTGYPQKPTSETWGNPISCQFSASYNLQGRVSGESNTTPNFVILIDEQPVTGDVVRLTSTKSGLVGVYQIRMVEPLDAVGQVKIVAAE